MLYRSLIGLITILAATNIAFAASDICDAFYQEAKSEKACFAYAAYAKKCGDHAFISFAEEYLARNCDGNVVDRQDKTDKKMTTATFKFKDKAPTSDKKAPDQELMRKCDLLAAPPAFINNNNPFNVSGVPFSEFKDTQPAINACFAAIEAFPDEARLSFQLGRAYHSEGSYRFAINAYKKAADQGYSSALSNLGDMYRHGHGVEKNLQKAAKLYRQAADQGDAVAQYYLASSYRNGEGVQVDYKQSAIWLSKSAVSGLISAQYQLGNTYLHGWGVDKNPETAVLWYQKSADQGHMSAQFELAKAYQNGSGVFPDTEIAQKWYGKSAAQGLREAQFNLGELISKDAKNYCTKVVLDALDDGSEDDYEAELFTIYVAECQSENRFAEKALGWFKKAAIQGHAESQIQLGIRLKRGDGAKQDYVEAVSWFQKAVDQNYGRAYVYLGQMYQAGDGVNKNLLSALTLYRKARTLSIDFAQTYIDRMYKSGSSSEIASQIQQQLKNLGYYDGDIDGKFGKGSEVALEAYCKC